MISRRKGHRTGIVILRLEKKDPSKKINNRLPFINTQKYICMCVWSEKKVWEIKVHTSVSICMESGERKATAKIEYWLNVVQSICYLTETHTHKFNTCNEYFCGNVSCIFLSAIALSHSRYVGPSFNVTLLKMQNCTENSSILLTFIQSLVLADSAVSNWRKCHTTTGKAHSKVGKTGKVKKAKRKLIEQLSGRVSAWTPERLSRRLRTLKFELEKLHIDVVAHLFFSCFHLLFTIYRYILHIHTS